VGADQNQHNNNKPKAPCQPIKIRLAFFLHTLKESLINPFSGRKKNQTTKSPVSGRKIPISSGIFRCFSPKPGFFASFGRNQPFAGKNCPRTIYKLDSAN